MNAVHSGNVTGFISGGTFSSEPGQDLLAEGFKPYKNADGSYGVTEETIYTVTVSDGDTTTSFQVPEGGMIDAPVAPADRAGYTFAGWETAGGTPVEFPYTVKGNLALVSTWTLDAPTVSVSADVEKPVEGDTVTLTATAASDADVDFAYQWLLDGKLIAGETGSTLKVTRPGSYSVRVTATDAADLSAEATSDALAVTFSPAEEPTPKPEPDQTVTVTFMYGDKVYATVEVPVDGSIPADKLPADPTWEGYVFSGWYVDAKNMTPETLVNLETDVFGSDTTLYAGFVPEGAQQPVEPAEPVAPDQRPAGDQGPAADEKNDQLAQTSDPTSLVPVAVAGAAGVSALAGALVARRRQR